MNESSAAVADSLIDDESSASGGFTRLDGSGSTQIQVFGRLRPSSKLARSQFSLDKAEKNVEFRVPKDQAAGYINNKKELYEFKFNGLFDPTATQEEVFDVVGKPIVMSVLEGFNATIFAYGQTGSGKTFTITGGPDRYEDRGIIPRSLSLIYDEIARRSANYTYQVRISYLEIYNEAGFDLLDPSKETKRLDELPRVSMQEDENHLIHMKNLGELPVNSVDEALNLLFVGDTNRIICETPSNDASSRSHCIFTISLECRENGGSRIRRSKLHLVDLAGSERTKKTNVTGNLFKEASFINLSLHYLEQVIVALHARSKGKSVHVPYRNSMMTAVLRDSLGGNCKTVMIATLSGESNHIDESISTARFAQRVAMIKNSAFINEEEDPKIVIRRLKDQIQELKDELAAARGGRVWSAELNDDELNYCRELVREFMRNGDANISSGANEGDKQFSFPVANPIKVKACFQAFSEIIKENKNKEKRENRKEESQSSRSHRNGGHRNRDDEEEESPSHRSAAVDEENQKLRVALQSRDAELSVINSMLKKGSIATSFSSQLGRNVGSEEIISAVRSYIADSMRNANGSNSDNSRAAQSSPSHSHSYSQPQSSSSSSPSRSQFFDKSLNRLSELHSAHAHTLKSSEAAIIEDAALLARRTAAFEEFKSSYQINQTVEEKKENLRSKIEAAKALGERINLARNNINNYKSLLEQKRIQRGVQSIADGDLNEDKLRQQLDNQRDESREENRIKVLIEEEKDVYRDKFNDLKALKIEIEHLKALVERSRRKLQLDFESFWKKQENSGEINYDNDGRNNQNIINNSNNNNNHSSHRERENEYKVQSSRSPSNYSAPAFSPSNSSVSTAAPLPQFQIPPFAPAASTASNSSRSTAPSNYSSRSASSANQRPASGKHRDSSDREHGGGKSANSTIVASALSSPAGSRLNSTGNSSVDADIARFYQLREKMMRSQQGRG